MLSFRQCRSQSPKSGTNSSRTFGSIGLFKDMKTTYMEDVGCAYVERGYVLINKIEEAMSDSNAWCVGRFE